MYPRKARKEDTRKKLIVPMDENNRKPMVICSDFKWKTMNK